MVNTMNSNGNTKTETEIMEGEVLSWEPPKNSQNNKPMPGKFKVRHKSTHPDSVADNGVAELTIYGVQDSNKNLTLDLPNWVTNLNPYSLVGATIRTEVKFYRVYQNHTNQYRPATTSIQVVAAATAQSQARAVKTLASQPDGMAIGNANNVAVELVKFLWTALERKPTDDDIRDGVRMVLLARNGIVGIDTEPDTTQSADDNDAPLFEG